MLQGSFASNVEPNDAAAQDDCQKISDKIQQFEEYLQNAGPVEEDSKLLEEINSACSDMSSVTSTFESYRNSTNERQALFENYSGAVAPLDVQDNFSTALLYHLSQQIVVKEHRFRYQREQLNRLAVAQVSSLFSNSNISLAQFCERYASLVEALI